MQPLDQLLCAQKLQGGEQQYQGHLVTIMVPDAKRTADWIDDNIIGRYCCNCMVVHNYMYNFCGPTIDETCLVYINFIRLNLFIHFDDCQIS